MTETVCNILADCELALEWGCVSLCSATDSCWTGSARPVGRCDMRSSRIITDYHKTKHFR